MQVTGHQKQEQSAQGVAVFVRGLPSCGKSTLCRELVLDGEVVCEFDEFFYTQVGTDPKSYDWDNDRIEEAHLWNFARFKEQIDRGVKQVMVDIHVAATRRTLTYVRYAVAKGYEIKIVEPKTPWWVVIRKLLDDKRKNRDVLIGWARKLREFSLSTHRVPLRTFLYRMNQWDKDLDAQRLIQAALEMFPEGVPQMRLAS